MRCSMVDSITGIASEIIECTSRVCVCRACGQQIPCWSGPLILLAIWCIRLQSLFLEIVPDICNIFIRSRACVC